MSSKLEKLQVRDLANTSEENKIAVAFGIIKLNEPPAPDPDLEFESEDFKSLAQSPERDLCNENKSDESKKWGISWLMLSSFLQTRGRPRLRG